MPRPARAKIDRPVRLRRNRPVNLSFARIILTGLLYPTIDHLYQGAQLLTIDPTTETTTTHNVYLGATFELDVTWTLRTVLDLDYGGAAADIVRRTRHTFSSPSGVS